MIEIPEYYNIRHRNISLFGEVSAESREIMKRSQKQNSLPRLTNKSNLQSLKMFNDPESSLVQRKYNRNLINKSALNIKSKNIWDSKIKRDPLEDEPLHKIPSKSKFDKNKIKIRMKRSKNESALAEAKTNSTQILHYSK